MKRVRVNDIDIAYQIDGAVDASRPWLVFSHSLACDHTMWEPQVAAFARTFNVLRFDTRGHGASSAPVGEYTLEQLADDLKGLLDALKIERCHFVGLSMGGMIGQVAALRFPLRFASLVLADTTSRYPAEMRGVWDERIAAVRTAQGMSAIVPATLERWFTASFRERRPDVVAGIAERIRATPVAGYVGCAHAISRINLTARLPTIACPVLVIVGEEDRGTPPAMAEEIVQAIAGARLQRIPQAAHLSNLEQPEAFNAALGGFLARVA
jgi:3-oxoadipate enol-lactonase